MFVVLDSLYILRTYFLLALSFSPCSPMCASRPEGYSWYLIYLPFETALVSIVHHAVQTYCQLQIELKLGLFGSFWTCKTCEVMILSQYSFEVGPWWILMFGRNQKNENTRNEAKYPAWLIVRSCLMVATESIMNIKIPFDSVSWNMCDSFCLSLVLLHCPTGNHHGSTCCVLRKTKSVVRKGVARGFYQLVKGHRTKENRTTDRQSISLPDQTAYGTALSQHHTDADYSILNTALFVSRFRVIL